MTQPNLIFNMQNHPANTIVALSDNRIMNINVFTQISLYCDQLSLFDE